ncbi:MAG TPA: FlgD immunoglobulin-like domain containing protein, partial [Gammaproteobacteria bacterium]|nr:FlgD immunoglobulin-like domain containing protein [Gammaproteobacteria bacterium]
LQAASLVGRTALVETDHGAIAAGGSLDGAVDVPAATGGVAVEIRTAGGQVVRHLQLGPQPAGLASFHWDGLDDAGAPVSAGTYQVVAGYQKDNSVAAATTLVDAPVDSVVFGADGFTVRLRGIGDVPFSDVREIRNDPI